MALDIEYFYSLTPRQFSNIQKGWADRRDGEQKERLILVRRLMYAALAPHSKGLTEQSIWPLDFEKDLLDKANERDEAQMIKELEAAAAFWERYDAGKAKA